MADTADRQFFRAWRFSQSASAGVSHGDVESAGLILQ